MDTIYTPKQFAAMIGRAVITLQKWDREGKLAAFRTPTNRRYYTHAQYLAYVGKTPTTKKIVTYCRVSSASQKNDLQSQQKAVEQFCIASGRAVGHRYHDIGSGLNYQRKSFLQLMEMVERFEIEQIIIAHKDRLVRFGFEWFEKFCKDHGCAIVVMNAESLSPEEEMTQDMLSIIHCFSSRLYGLRKYKKQITSQVREVETVKQS